MKSKELISFENKIIESDDIDFIMKMGYILFSKKRLIELKNEEEKIRKLMYEDGRAELFLQEPNLSDEEIFFACNTIKGRARQLGEKLKNPVIDKEEDDEPKTI